MDDPRGRGEVPDDGQGESERRHEGFINSDTYLVSWFTCIAGEIYAFWQGWYMRIYRLETPSDDERKDISLVLDRQ